MLQLAAAGLVGIGILEMIGRHAGRQWQIQAEAESESDAEALTTLNLGQIEPRHCRILRKTLHPEHDDQDDENQQATRFSTQDSSRSSVVSCKAACGKPGCSARRDLVDVGLLRADADARSEVLRLNLDAVRAPLRCMPRPRTDSVYETGILTVD